MIKFQEKNKTFNLISKDSSYIFHINEAGYLVHDYYGKKIEGDLSYLNQISEIGTFKRSQLDFENSFDFSMGEIGSSARGDFKDPSIVIERKDGAIFSRYKYVSHKIYKGAPSISDQPHVRGAKETLEVLLKDDFSDCYIKLNYSVYDELNAIVRNTVVLNKGEDAVYIKKIASFTLDLPDSNYNLMKLPGSWARERHIEISKISKGINRIHSLRGTSSHHMNPFMGLLRDNTTELSGECFGFNLIYSGQHMMEAESTFLDYLRVLGGINDFNFKWKLEPNSEFVSPQAVMVYSNDGITSMSQTFHDLYRNYLINPSFVYKTRPIVINNWEATYFDFNYDKLFKLADKASEIGVDTFVLDDGWFGHRDDDTSSLGDWFIYKEKLQDGLKPIIDYVNSKGMKFGLWFEPEMVSEDSVLYKKHPEWALAKLGVEPTRSRNQLVLDFSNKEVVDYIYNQIAEILRNNHIEYVKWDHNRSLSEYYSNNLDSDHMGEVFHRYVLGYYDLSNRLTSDFPDIFFEGCCSGGGRFDAATLYYFPQIWTSDDTDGYERCKIQYGTSICYPLSSMSCHVSTVPNHQTGRITPFKTRVDIASLGSFGYELNLPDLTKEELDEAKEGIIRYKKNSDLILNGDLYRLYSPFESNFFAFLVVSKKKDQAFVVVEKILSRPVDTKYQLKLTGLKKDSIYHVEELGINLTQSELENFGLCLYLKGDFVTTTFTLKEIN